MEPSRGQGKPLVSPPGDRREEAANPGQAIRMGIEPTKAPVECEKYHPAGNNKMFPVYSEARIREK
jgi:hypothetical protein